MWLLAAVVSVLIGLSLGLLGGGGSMLTVPILIYVLGVEPKSAIATSLVVGAAIVGILIGGQLAGRVPHQALRKWFGWFVLAMAIFLVGKQIF